MRKRAELCRSDRPPNKVGHFASRFVKTCFEGVAAGRSQRLRFLAWTRTRCLCGKTFHSAQLYLLRFLCCRIKRLAPDCRGPRTAAGDQQQSLSSAADASMFCETESRVSIQKTGDIHADPDLNPSTLGATGTLLIRFIR